MAARANAGSSSCSSKSPRLGQQWCAGSSTPSPRSSQDGQRSRKRKSPHVCTPLFRSPLSRMLLSPRMQLPRAHIRSPLVSRRATLLDIDLNMEPEDSQENPEGDPLGQQNEENGSNLQGDLLGHQNEENGSNLGGDSHSQQNAHRIYLSNEKRRQIFDSLLSKATNGEMKGHETTEVSAEFSVPI